ncbi:MAG: UvrD-helicase domain-containing protein, partial [Mailhella sp.]|nr:UvrD-helicase domain-containing protein [Mailhella sp.]
MSSQQKYVERLVIKASAGTGKTHNLTGFYLGSLGHVSKKWTAEDKEKFLLKGKTACAPEDIIAVTFTKKAAAELKERLRQDLLKEGRYDEAARVDGSLIGTVHSVCLRLLQEYALEAGNSPVAEELSEDDGAVLFRRAVAPLMEDFAYLNDLFYEFGMELGGFGKKDRSQAMLEFCRGFIAMARTNGLEGKLNELGEESFETVRKQMDAICPPLAGDGEAELASMHEELEKLIAVQKIEGNYERTGKVDKEEKAQGVKNLSTAEKKHLKLMG